MQYKVPQFIEVEDKIFGPFTLKQFSYMMGGFGLSIVVWRTFADSSFVLFLVAPVIALSLALTFLKPNGKPFIFMVQNLLYFVFSPRKLFWRTPTVSESKENVRTAKKEQDKVELKTKVTPRKIFSQDQIRNVAKYLDKK